MSAIQLVLVAVFSAMVATSEASAFLQASYHQHPIDRVSQEDVQTSLLEEIEGSLGTGIAAKRVHEMQAILIPMFPSLPKNAYGNLEHATVRYALHRAFLQRHGWCILGLDPAGAGWNSSSPTGILKDQAPSYIQELFEQRLGERGLALHEVAVFGATIEHLVHNEAIGRLGVAMNVHNLLPTSLMTSDEADEVLDTYMMAYILGEHLGNMTLKDVRHLTKQMPEIFLSWRDTQAFVRELRKQATESRQLARVGASNQNKEYHSIDFATLVSVAETVGEQFGKFQDKECQGLKASLVKMEEHGSGRVRLSDFYKPALNGDWQFQESIGYLREIGTLDESGSDEPRVMISNYLLSQANCIASSDYYSVCCIDECENLHLHVEKVVGDPIATPAQIIDIVSNMASSSVPAPRVLSATLQMRIEEMASLYDGRVQLHGRLFSQWLHHAYPRECPFPHISGTTSQQSAEQYSGKNDGDSVASQEELIQFTSASNSTEPKELRPDEDVHDLMMWSLEEELLVVHSPQVAFGQSGLAPFAKGAGNFVLVGIAASLLVGMARATSKSSSGGHVPQKFMV
jgi:hypothetical protein